VVDPASMAGTPESMRDMFGLSLSVKADATVTPLGSDYQVVFPQLNEENTFDVTAEMMPETAEKVFDSAMVEIEYNGEVLQLENVPILLDDRTFVPLRELANAFGISDADIAYDEATEKVTIKSGDVEIVMYIGSTMTFVNNELKTLDVPAFTHNDRTYIPVRFVSEMFHKDVDYVDLNATGQGSGIVVMIND
ncbi:MAG: copper amine oxidase N-terminal domain-containing protein, partial [Clostridia bacterium]|nr:copper amine oxidase N-terminal domain-containing protein [Clostridia bacterium]